MTKPITKSQAVAVAKAVIAAEPDTTNPLSPEFASCIYHAGRGRNIRRCIVGRVGWVLGLPTPAAGAGPVDELAEPDDVWAGLLTPAAVDYLGTLQRVADNEGNFFPLPWGEIPKSVVAGRA